MPLLLELGLDPQHKSPVRYWCYLDRSAETVLPRLLVLEAAVLRLINAIDRDRLR